MVKSAFFDAAAAMTRLADEGRRRPLASDAEPGAVRREAVTGPPAADAERRSAGDDVDVLCDAGASGRPGVTPAPQPLPRAAAVPATSIPAADSASWSRDRSRCSHSRSSSWSRASGGAGLRRPATPRPPTANPAATDAIDAPPSPRPSTRASGGGSATPAAAPMPVAAASSRRTDTRCGADRAAAQPLSAAASSVRGQRRRRHGWRRQRRRVHDGFWGGIPPIVSHGRGSGGEERRRPLPPRRVDYGEGGVRGGGTRRVSARRTCCSCRRTTSGCRRSRTCTCPTVRRRCGG